MREIVSRYQFRNDIKCVFRKYNSGIKTTITKGQTTRIDLCKDNQKRYKNIHI